MMFHSKLLLIVVQFIIKRSNNIRVSIAFSIHDAGQERRSDDDKELHKDTEVERLDDT